MDQDKIRPLIGKDEMNLTEFPLTLLTDKASKEILTIEYTDRQHNLIRNWKITGSAEYGLLRASDEHTYLAMMLLTKLNRFRDKKVFFNPYKMLKVMKWPVNGKHYDKLEESLSRLTGITVYVNYLWDNGEFKEYRGKTGFHIIDKFLILKGKKGSRNSFFKWGDDIFESLSHGNIRDIDLDIYFSLKTPISKRFFRFYDKRLYKRDTTSFDLLELAHEKLGITRSMIYPSELKRKLQPTLKEHKEKKLLSETKYTKTKTGWILTIKKHRNESEPGGPEKPQQESCTKPLSRSAQGETDQAEKRPAKNPLIDRLVDLGITQKVAYDLVMTIDPDIIENQIEALPYRKNIEDKAAFLVQSIRDNFPLPKEFMRRKARAIQEKEDELRTKYSRYILETVDAHLKTLNPEEVKREIEAHREIYLSKVPDYFQTDLSPEYLDKENERDYRKDKAKELNLPDFESWRKG